MVLPPQRRPAGRRGSRGATPPGTGGPPTALPLQVFTAHGGRIGGLQAPRLAVRKGRLVRGVGEEVIVTRSQVVPRGLPTSGNGVSSKSPWSVPTASPSLASAPYRIRAKSGCYVKVSLRAGLDASLRDQFWGIQTQSADRRG